MTEVSWEQNECGIEKDYMISVGRLCLRPFNFPFLFLKFNMYVVYEVFP